MNKIKDKSRIEFLKTFFDDKKQFEFKEVNGFILTKNISGETGNIYVSVFSKESWKRSKEYLNQQQTTLL